MKWYCPDCNEVMNEYSADTARDSCEGYFREWKVCPDCGQTLREVNDNFTPEGEEDNDF